VEMNLLDVGIVDFGFGFTEHLEDAERRCFCVLRYRRLADDIANLAQSAMRMRVRLIVRVLVIMLVFMAVRMRVHRAIGVAVLMDMPTLLRPVLIARHILLAMDDDINFGCGHAIAQDARDLEFRSDVQGAHGSGETPASTRAPRNMSPLIPLKQSR